MLLSVCLALHFKQDQELVMKGPLGHRTLIPIANLIADFFCEVLEPVVVVVSV